MSDTLFGTSGPTWSGMSAPGFSAFSRPGPIGTSPFGAPLQNPMYGLTPQPYGYSGVTPGLPLGSTPGAGFGSMPVFGTAGAFPGTIGPEVPIAMVAPAILAAVAMRRGQPIGPTSDQEIEEFIYDALELLPGTSEVEVRCDNGRATLTGTVQHKRLKHAVGELAWAIPHISDVENDVAIATRRRARSHRETETAPTSSGRKQG
jgi:hypothetical protein